MRDRSDPLLPRLKGGADHKLRVWSLVDGSCAQTMFSHTAGVTGLAIVERGRNILCMLLFDGWNDENVKLKACFCLFLACSRDGSVKLWDVGTNQVLRNGVLKVFLYYS